MCVCVCHYVDMYVCVVHADGHIAYMCNNNNIVVMFLLIDIFTDSVCACLVAAMPCCHSIEQHNYNVCMYNI